MHVETQSGPALWRFCSLVESVFTNRNFIIKFRDDFRLREWSRPKVAYFVQKLVTILLMIYNSFKQADSVPKLVFIYSYTTNWRKLWPWIPIKYVCCVAQDVLYRIYFHTQIQSRHTSDHIWKIFEIHLEILSENETFLFILPLKSLLMHALCKNS